MKKTLLFIILFLSIISFLPTSCLNVNASEGVEHYKDSYYTYTIINGKATIIDVDQTISGDVTIPHNLGVYPVVSIGDLAFSNCLNLKTLIIPEDIKSIGYEAFYNCTNLASISLPITCNDLNFNILFGDSIPSTLKEVIVTKADKIPVGYFSHIKNIERIILPNSITTIEESAFRDCTSLASLIIPDSVKNIGEFAFIGCTSLTNITIGNGVEIIGSSSFSDCTSLTSITIPDNVMSIGSYAFAACRNLTNITIGNGVTSIGESAFHDCVSLKSISLPIVDNDIILGGLFDYSIPKTLNEITITKADEIPSSYFSYFENVKSIVISNGVNSIGNRAFYDCKSLTSIEIPDSATSIAEQAFAGCTSLTNITIPDNVIRIDSYAFASCRNLTNITIGDGVTSIGENVFTGCSSLTNITVSDNNNRYSSINGVLYNKNQTEIICYPVRKRDTIYIIPDSVTNIGEYAFYNCNNVTDIIIFDSVNSISDEAFGGCSNLENVYYCGSESEWNNIFIGCNNYDLTSATRYYHNFGLWQVRAESTCTKKGEKYRICSICGDEDTNEIELTSHKYDNDCDTSCNVCSNIRNITHDYTDADCITPKTCKICGVISGQALGHKYNSGKVTKAATCKATGVKTYTCSVCKGTKTETIAKLTTHTYSNNCDKSCNVCGKTRTVGAHKYSNSCDTTCNYCNAKRTIKHTYTNACDTTCNVCKDKRTIKHTYSNNCDTSCNVCKSTRTITHAYKTTTTKATLSKNGSVVKKCTVCGKVASNSAIKYAKTFKLSTTSYTYNGKVKIPSVTVKDSTGKTLKKNTDYTVTYASGRKNVGTYKVTIKMKGNYTGTKVLTFKINPAKTTVSKLTAGKKSITVTITKKSTQVTGYQIQYSTSKTFSKATTKTISSYKTTKYVLKSLSAKKTYYVRVRTYKTVGKTKYYSGWSTAKYAKTK